MCIVLCKYVYTVDENIFIHFNLLNTTLIHFNLLNTTLYICKYIHIVLYMYVVIINTHTSRERDVYDCLFVYVLLFIREKLLFITFKKNLPTNYCCGGINTVISRHDQQWVNAVISLRDR